MREGELSGFCMDEIRFDFFCFLKKKGVRRRMLER